jgi:transposase
VSVPSVYRICRLEKQNRLKPKPFPGRKSILTPELLEKIRETVLENNDITLEELIEKLDLPIKKSRLSVVLIGMGLSFKKTGSSLN